MPRVSHTRLQVIKCAPAVALLRLGPVELHAIGPLQTSNVPAHGTMHGGKGYTRVGLQTPAKKSGGLGLVVGLLFLGRAPCLPGVASPCSHGGIEARREYLGEPTTRHRGQLICPVSVSRALACIRAVCACMVCSALSTSVEVKGGNDDL